MCVCVCVWGGGGGGDCEVSSFIDKQELVNIFVTGVTLSHFCCNTFPLLAGVDYSTVDRNVEFAPGEVTREVQVRIQNDIFPEENKTFEVYLAASPGVYLHPITYTTVRILNDDPDLPGEACNTLQ